MAGRGLRHPLWEGLRNVPVAESRLPNRRRPGPACTAQHATSKCGHTSHCPGCRDTDSNLRCDCPAHSELALMLSCHVRLACILGARAVVVEVVFRRRTRQRRLHPGCWPLILGLAVRCETLGVWLVLGSCRPAGVGFAQGAGSQGPHI